MSLVSNTETSKFYHELLKILPYNAFIEKIKRSGVKWYCNGKVIEPTAKEVFIAILYNLSRNTIFSHPNEPESEWQYRYWFICKLESIVEKTGRSSVDYFSIRYNHNKNTLRIYFSDVSKIRCKTRPFKLASMILEYKINQK